MQTMMNRVHYSNYVLVVGHLRSLLFRDKMHSIPKQYGQDVLAPEFINLHVIFKCHHCLMNTHKTVA